MAKKNAEFCHAVRLKIEKHRDDFRDNINNYHSWFNFVMGNQWEDNEEDLLRQYGKRPLVMNKLSPLNKHLQGEQRQNTPNLQAVPDETASVETIEVRNALLKSIMFNSDAKVVYQNSFQQSVVGGYGAYDIETEYVGKSFNQEPRVRLIRDATKCYWDLSAQTPNKTDGMFSGTITRMSREMFRQIYGKRVEAAIGENYGEIDTKFVWSNADEIAVIKHYQRKIIKDTLYLLSNGEMILDDEFQESLQPYYPDDSTDDTDKTAEVIVRNGQVVTVEREREYIRNEITIYKMAGDYILDETEFPADELGLVFVDQNSWWDKKGKQICVPFFKDGHDPQVYLNYLATMSAYIWKVSRYDQYMASKANVRSPDTQQIWRDPATYQGALIYDVDAEGGTKPERVKPPELPDAFVTQYQRALDDIHSSTGIYGTQIGQQGAELSGAAVDARTRQGSYVSYTAFDSLNRAIATGGRIINQMISRLYDTEREIMIDLPDKGASRVTINQQDEYGNILANNMVEGEYKVKLLPGPSAEGQLAQSIESMNAVIQADRTGQVFPLIADLYADNLEMNQKVEMKNRLRTMVPPEIIEAGKTGQMPPPKKPQPDPALMAAQAKLMEVQVKQQKLKEESHKYALDIQQQQQQLETERMEAAAKLQEQELRYQAETNRANTDMQIAHADNLVKILTHTPKMNPQNR